jgi:hypothetical protein
LGTWTYLIFGVAYQQTANVTDLILPSIQALFILEEERLQAKLELSFQ